MFAKQTYKDTRSQNINKHYNIEYSTITVDYFSMLLTLLVIFFYKIFSLSFNKIKMTNSTALAMGETVNEY